MQYARLFLDVQCTFRLLLRISSPTRMHRVRQHSVPVESRCLMRMNGGTRQLSSIVYFNS